MIKLANFNDDFTYSAILRYIRKTYPESVKEFMKEFKAAFDEAAKSKVEPLEESALMQAIQSMKSKL